MGGLPPILQIRDVQHAARQSTYLASVGVQIDAILFGTFRETLWRIVCTQRNPGRNWRREIQDSQSLDPFYSMYLCTRDHATAYFGRVVSWLS